MKTKEIDIREFKGTPGPWKAVELPYKIGICTHEIQFNEDGECVTDGVYGKENAQLIAAAPELLQALQDIYEVMCDNIGNQLKILDCENIAKKAIHKALGI